MNMNKPFHQPVLKLPAYTPDKLWQLTLAELRHQMTKTTFNHVLLGSYLLTTASTSAFWVIVVRNESACDWLTYQLNQVVKRTLVGLIGFEVTICFIPKPR